MNGKEEWLQLAPTPPALRPDHRWHVFLSYRSVHRTWVIHLYDVLNVLGYQVFLDQYVLAAADHLVGSLEEGLYKSASGILVWSAATEDSEWCNKEYRSMETRATQDENFHYVIAVLDKVELPGFARERIYVDFSEHRGGPRGTGLLRLLFGLTGNPMSDAAIRLAAKVDEGTRQAEAAIRGALDTGNSDRLISLAESTSLAWTTSAMLACQVAESLTKLGKNEESLQLLEKVIAKFPKAVRPLQLKGMGLARSGNLEEAQNVLGDLVAAGEKDPETLGIYARTWADRYKESNNRLHLRHSRDLYAQAFENTPQDYYTGINAASKSLFLGDHEAAERYAGQVEGIVGTEKHEGDYWKTATVAEVQLIRRNYEKAGELYEGAVTIAPEEVASHSSTWNQAKLLMDKLEASPEERERVGRAFAHLETADT